MILCIIDGMNHRGFHINQFTNMSRLAEDGAYGWVRTIADGEEPETAACVARLLGAKGTFGRGYLEALGAGIPVEPDDTVLRGTWLDLDENNCVLGISKEAPSFSAAGYWSIGGYRAVIKLRGSRSVQTAAPHNYIGRPVREVMPVGDDELTALVKKSMSGKQILVPWGASRMAPLERLGYSIALVTGTAVVAGLGKALGLPVYCPAGATADIDTDLDAKIQQTLDLYDNYEVVVLHINGADEAGHRRSILEKNAFIDLVDRQVLAKLNNRKAVICSDHGTEPATGAHSAGVQPMIAHGWGCVGAVGEIEGTMLLEEVQKWLER